MVTVELNHLEGSRVKHQIHICEISHANFKDLGFFFEGEGLYRTVDEDC